MSTLKNRSAINMKPITILFFISISMSLRLDAQNMNAFYYEVNVAKNLASSGKTDSAIVVYEKAFEKRNYVPVRYLKSVLKLAKLKDDKKRIKDYSNRIETQSLGSSPQLMAVLDSLIKEDQKVRSNRSYRNAQYFWKCTDDPDCDKHSKKFAKAQLIAEHWRKTDSMNTYFLLDLFEQHGFIGEELVGPDKAQFVRIVLLHFDADTNNAILGPVLKRARDEGKLHPLEYAQILDRHHSGDTAKQLYWTWPDANKQKYPFTEKDIPGILKQRESIGLYGTQLKQEFKRNYWIIRNVF